MSKIWAWVTSVWSSATSGVQALWNHVVAMVQAIVSDFETAFEDVAGGWTAFESDMERLANDLNNAFPGVYRAIRWLRLNVAQPMYDGLKSQYHDIVQLIDTVRMSAADDVRQLERDIESGVYSAESWVVRHVSTPIYAVLADIEKFQSRYVSPIIDLIEHPQRLASLLLSPLLHAGIALLEGSSSYIAGWLLSGIFSAMVEGANVAEDIFSKMV